MALSAALRVKVRYYLGWSARFHQFDSRLEQAMDALASDFETQDLVETMITSLEDIDTKLTDAHNRIKAAKVGSINLQQNEIAFLRNEGKRHVGRLAATLGVEVRQDVFSSTSFKSFAGYGGLYPGGSGNKMNIG